MRVANRPKVVNLDCRAIWGKFLLALRENKELSLHALCVELSDYRIENNVFWVGVSKKINYDSLRKLSNLKRINEVFSLLNLGLEIKFTYQEVTNEDKEKIISQILGVKVNKK